MLSGHCTEGICCNTQCDEVCRACAAAVKNDGTPDGVCGYAAPNKELGWKCVDEVEVFQKCDGSGQPIAVIANNCKPNRCDDFGAKCATECPCSDAGFCTDAGPPGGGSGGGGGAGGGGPSALHCEPRRDEGEKCTEDIQCTKSHCVDGVCCNVACNGQCQACDTQNNVGYCSNLGSKDKPEPPRRKACEGAGTACEGYCDGQDDDGCTYPGKSKECAAPSCACADDDCEVGPGTGERSECDGNGACVEVIADCGGFRCEGTSLCKTSCKSDGDCIEDFTCEGDACAPLKGPKCDGDHTVKLPKAVDQDCTPIKCKGQACLAQCESVDDCVAPSVCNSAGQCVSPLSPPTLPSCSCELAGDPGTAGYRGRFAPPPRWPPWPRGARAAAGETPFRCHSTNSCAS